MLELARQPVAGPRGARATDDVCRHLADDRFAIDGRELTLPMQIADFALLGQVFAVPTRGARAVLEDRDGDVDPDDVKAAHAWANGTR